jgi:hypothetical protein
MVQTQERRPRKAFSVHHLQCTVPPREHCGGLRVPYRRDLQGIGEQVLMFNLSVRVYVVELSALVP